MSECMEFPKTFDEFAKYYGFKDKDEVYTNGSELIPVFRVKQWLEHISTTKNDLGVELIDRVELLKAMDTWDKFGYTTRYGLERLDKDDKGFVPYVKYEDMVNCVKCMPSVTPQESILDKIREEVESIEHYGTNDGNDFWLRTPNEIKKDVLAILDKYKAESEEVKNDY